MPDAEVQLTIEASPEEMSQAREAAYREMAPHVAVHGFRPGKAPRPMIERQIGSERLLSEALGDLLPRLYRQALEQESIRPYADGNIEVVQRDPALIRARIPLFPVVELGDYRSMSVERPQVSVEESELDSILADLQEHHAEWVPVLETRSVQLGDQVVIDLRGDTDEGALVDRKGVETVVSEEPGMLMPGLATEVAGSEVDVERVVQMTVPETFWNEKQRGKQATFTFTVHQIRDKHLLPLDDDFARTTGQAQTLAELRDLAKFSILTQKRVKADELLEQQVLDKAISISKLEFPRAMVDEELDRIVERRADRFKSRGVSLDAYLRMTGATLESYRQQLEPEASASVKEGLILAYVSEAETITVDESEIDDEIERITLSDPEGTAEQATKNRANRNVRRNVRNYLVERKTRQRMVALATPAGAADAIPPTGEEAAPDTTGEVATTAEASPTDTN
jgi:trigger factor